MVYLSMQTPTHRTGGCVLTMDRTVECKHCLQAHGSITPPFVSFTIQPSKPMYCPKCGKHRLIRPYDYADVLCTDHAGLPRSFALRCIALYNEQRDRGTLHKPTHDPIDYLNDMGAQSMPSVRSSITPLDVHCNKCGGSYTLLRNVPDVQRTPPLYCIWCASSNVVTMQESTDDTCWTSLATHYNLPLNVLKLFYSRWQTHSQRESFSDYMQSDMIQEVLKSVVA